MLQTIQIQTPDGIKAYPFVHDSIEYESAVADGEIAEGMDIVYRSFLVHIIHESEMLVLTQIMPFGNMQGFNFITNHSAGMNGG